jgi:hypothetical protein
MAEDYHLPARVRGERIGQRRDAFARQVAERGVEHARIAQAGAGELVRLADVKQAQGGLFAQPRGELVRGYFR